jgi:predicted enzyme related to lactoylglutathione lyase
MRELGLPALYNQAFGDKPFCGGWVFTGSDLPMSRQESSPVIRSSVPKSARKDKIMKIRHQDFEDAAAFYAQVLGFENRSDDPEVADFNAHPINLFVIADDEFSGPVLELFVGNLEEARDYLVEHGCKVLRWRGKGQDCYIQDPFGVIYNLWEE